MAIAAMYLKMTGITGESLANGHVGDIDLVSWDWGLQSAPYALGDGSPGGASSFNALNIVKRVDRATPTLFKFCDEHKVVSSATLTVSKASGASPLEYDFWSWTMERFEGAAAGFTAASFPALLEEVRLDD